MTGKLSTTKLWVLIDTHFVFLGVKVAMQKFSQNIVGMMKSEGLFESQGGPIILSQVNIM